MDFLTVLTVAVRRRWVVLPVLLLTVIGAVLIARRTQPEYQVQGSVLLTSRGGGVEASRAFSVSLSNMVVAAGLVAAATNSDEVREGLALPPETQYRVEADSSSAVLRVTASGADGPSAAQAVNAVLGELTHVAQTLSGPIADAVQVRIVSRPNDLGQANPVEGSAVLLPLPGTTNTSYPASAVTGRILQEVLGDADMVRAVVAAGGTGTYAVEPQDNDPAPILYITATGADERRVATTFDILVKRINEELSARQAAAGVVNRAQTWADVLNDPEGAVLQSTNLLRPLITVVGLGLIAAFCLAVFVESLLGSKIGRRHSASPAGYNTEGSRDDVYPAPSDGGWRTPA